MFNRPMIIEDRKHNTFMVQCETQDFAERMFEKITELWDLAMEHYGEAGTYAYDLTHSADLLANVPCNGTLMLWFDIDMGDDHDRMFDTVLKFIEQCFAEVLGSDALSLETMITSK